MQIYNTVIIISHLTQKGPLSIQSPAAWANFLRYTMKVFYFWSMLRGYTMAGWQTLYLYIIVTLYT